MNAAIPALLPPRIPSRADTAASGYGPAKQRPAAERPRGGHGTGRLYEHQGTAEAADPGVQAGGCDYGQARDASPRRFRGAGPFAQQLLASIIAQMGGAAGSFTRGLYVDTYV